MKLVSERVSYDYDESNNQRQFNRSFFKVNNKRFQSTDLSCFDTKRWSILRWNLQTDIYGSVDVSWSIMVKGLLKFEAIVEICAIQSKKNLTALDQKEIREKWFVASQSIPTIVQSDHTFNLSFRGKVDLTDDEGNVLVKVAPADFQHNWIVAPCLQSWNF